MKHFLVYHVEILRAIPPKDSPRLETIEYCDGWHDFAGMGISVIGFFDSAYPATYQIALGFDTDALNDFEALASERVVIGFNSRGFHDKVMGAHGYSIHSDFDLLHEVRLASGQPPTYERGVTRAGYSLDALAWSNLDEGKISKGDVAPIDWQQGRKSKVINYVLHDIYLTHELLTLWMARGFLNDPSPQRVGDLLGHECVSPEFADFLRFCAHHMSPLPRWLNNRK